MAYKQIVCQGLHAFQSACNKHLPIFRIYVYIFSLWSCPNSRQAKVLFCTHPYALGQLALFRTFFQLYMTEI